MDPLRLTEVADAVIEALLELHRENRQSAYPPDLVGTIAQPKALAGFSRDEVQEGTDFLVRLGVIELAPGA